MAENTCHTPRLFRRRAMLYLLFSMSSAAPLRFQSPAFYAAYASDATPAVATPCRLHLRCRRTLLPLTLIIEMLPAAMLFTIDIFCFR